MTLRVVTISDGFESSTVPSVVDVVGTRTQAYELTSGEVIAKKVLLSVAPGSPGSLVLSYNGIIQYPGKDFIVSGAEIIFDGYNMGPDIAIGDEIIATYQ
jgi:hypothetical protein